MYSSLDSKGFFHAVNKVLIPSLDVDDPHNYTRPNSQRGEAVRVTKNS
jgi:hypothetical protein